MKLQFKYQKFQADAAKAVADVFDGQPYLAPSYMTGEISGKNSSSEERLSLIHISEPTRPY